MDTMDNGDIYLSYLTNDKGHCDIETNTLASENEVNLEPIETMFADISDGNLAWTIDGYSILMNPDQTKEPIIANIKSSNNADLSISMNGGQHEPLLLQQNLEILCKHQSINDNSILETTKDPIINGSGTVKQQSLKNLPVINTSVLKNCRSILKSSAIETVKIADMIEEVSAFSCRKCGVLCRVRQEIIDHVKMIHFEKNRVKSGLSSNEISTNTQEGTVNEESVSVVYLCGICGQVGYNSQEILRQHMINVHAVEETAEETPKINTPMIPNKEGGKEKCEVNIRSSNILRNYQLYVQNQQKNVSKIRCSVDYCESRFVNDEIRLLHEQCHSDYLFSNNNSGDVVGVTSLQDYRYKCPQCNTRFVLWKSCASHLWARHRIDIGLYSCPMCTKFKSISPHIVYNHLSSIHLSTNHPTTTTKPCLCNICGARYKSLSQLRIHIDRTHRPSPTPPTTYSCTICQRNFATAQSLRKHSDQLHTKSKMLACTSCDYRTTRADSMATHERGHSGEKPYKCATCSFSTGDRSTLKRHEMRHGRIVSYACPHCPFTSIQSVNYKKHLMRKHPGEAGLYTCHICGTHYIRQSAFTAHMRDHRMGLMQSPTTLEEVEDGDEVSSATSVDTEAVTTRKLPLVSILRRQMTSTNSEESEECVDDPYEEM